MSYPNYKNKHLEKSLFNPNDFLKYKKIKDKNFPRNWIITWQSSVKEYIKNKLKLKKRDLNLQGEIWKKRNIGIIWMRGIGSPHASTNMEEIIARGGKRFILIGTSGGLQDFGIFLCERSIRDEGTSHHYLPASKYSYPSKELSKEFENSLLNNKIKIEKGTSWTIDAPYRETKKEIMHYKKEGVKTVEMESSSLFAVAKVRKVEIAAAFIVSDILGEKKWDPNFDSKHVKIKLNKVLNAAIECLSNK
jgi:uridine phosphorylase